jgi:hypothetical protein
VLNEVKSINLTRIWEENKKFLLYTGGVVVVFLFLLTTIANYQADANVYVNRYHHDMGETQSLYQSVRDHYHESRNRLNDFQALERELLVDYGPKLSETNFVAIEEFGGKELFFKKRIDDIWQEIKTKKTRQSIDCEIPKAINTSALGVSADDTNEDTIRNQKYLEILRRGLNILIDSGMTKIHPPRLASESANGIKDNPGHEAVFQRITIEAEGPFRSFTRVFEAAQKLEREKKGGVQVLLLDLGPEKRAKNDSRGLRGRLEFRAFSIEEARSDRKKTGKSGRKRVRARR